MVSENYGEIILRNPKKIILIGLCGKARVGKDTVADYLVDALMFQKYSFAGPLKRAVCEMFGITMDMFENEELKEKVIPFWGYSPRQMAQKLGTEGGRDLFDKNIWVRRAHIHWQSLLKSSQVITNIDESLSPSIQGLVVSDIRFENEAAWIRQEGGTVWHIERDDSISVSSHSSEDGVNPLKGDMRIINNGTIEYLHQNTEAALARMFLPKDLGL